MQHSDVFNLVERGLAELEFADTFLVELKIKNNLIEVFLDSDESVNFLKCQKLSRWLETIFDENKAFGDSYTLEVSSAGVGSPLKFLRQYAKNVGRIIDVKYGEGKNAKGVLKKVDGNLIFVEYDAKIKEGKKNKKVIVIDEIKFEDIIESRVKISFN